MKLRLLRERHMNGGYIPMTGEVAKCQHGKRGVVEKIVVEDSELLFVGEKVDKNERWQSKDPKPVS
jgi:hypothetical protein